MLTYPHKVALFPLQLPSTLGVEGLGGGCESALWGQPLYHVRDWLSCSWQPKERGPYVGNILGSMSGQGRDKRWSRTRPLYCLPGQNTGILSGASVPSLPRSILKCQAILTLAHRESSQTLFGSRWELLQKNAGSRLPDIPTLGRQVGTDGAGRKHPRTAGSRMHFQDHRPPQPLHRVLAPHVFLPPSSCLKKVPEALRKLYIILEAKRE